MNSYIKHILDELNKYKRKYFLRLFLQGAVVFFALAIFLYLFICALEFIGHFNSQTRLILLISFFTLFVFFLVKYLVLPFKRFINNKNELSNDIAAMRIGDSLPNISDKLLNTIQLLGISNDNKELLTATLEQRSQEFQNIDFSSVIQFDDFKKKYILLLLLPLFALIFSIVKFPEFASTPAKRIVQFNTEFVPQSPFDFNLKSPVKSFINENYDIKIELSGNSIPSQLYVQIDGINHQMLQDNDNNFNYTIDKITDDIELVFEGSGYKSKLYEITAIHRPSFTGFSAIIKHPSYTNIPDKTINTIGTLSIPEGSTIIWDINTEYTDSIQLYIEPTQETIEAKDENGNITFQRKVLASEIHTLQAFNHDAASKERFHYAVNTIDDKFPSLSIRPFQDSILYRYLFVNGNISDDYGISRLQFHYRKSTNLEKSNFLAQAIPFNKSITQQTFNFELNLDSLNINEGESIEYFVSVWDNDAIHGAKQTKSQLYTFTLPSKQSIEQNINEASTANSLDMENALNEAKQLKKQVEELSKNLKTKKELDWQDKKDVEKVIDKHNKLQKQIEQLEQRMEQNQMKEERFNQFDENIQEKAQQLQKLVQQIMDDDTRKMMEELHRLMNENIDKEELDQLLEELNQKDENLENELDRTIEMYKNLKFEKDLQKATKDLEELAKSQKELSELTENKEIDNDILQKEQEHINEEFDRLKDKMDQLQKDASELGRKEDFDQLSKTSEQIEEELNSAEQQLQNGKNKKAGESQKNAADKMEQMAQQMQQMQQQEQMQAAQENLDDLRDILENLLTLSFSQEELINNFKGLRQSDPRFVQLSQDQLKLFDDSRVIEDSLLSLAKRVFQIESFITREVTAMKNNLNAASESLKDRHIGKARSNQQYAMTSINNLALLLSDVMEQLQQQMAQQMPGEQQCNKPGQNKKPGLGQMQKDLNQMIQQLKNGQKQGRSLSEQLAKMAAQQQKLRQALKEMEGSKDANGKDIGDELKKISEMMEETEKDLLYKKYDSKTIERNQEILTRLLEAEEAQQQRDLDNKREAQQATNKPRTTSPQLDLYLQQKEKQLELLKTIPPSLNPYFKNEVDEYFNTIEN